MLILHPQRFFTMALKKVPETRKEKDRFEQKNIMFQMWGVFHFRLSRRRPTQKGKNSYSNQPQEIAGLIKGLLTIGFP